MQTIEYRVTGMSCGHCESAIRGEVGKLDGVEQVDVSAASGRLVITAVGVDADVIDADVLAAVDEAGYSAERI